MEPERVLLLNEHAIVEYLRRAGWKRLKEVKLDGVEGKDGKDGEVKEGNGHVGVDGSGLSEGVKEGDRKILSRTKGLIRGWVPIDTPMAVNS